VALQMQQVVHQGQHSQVAKSCGQQELNGSSQTDISTSEASCQASHPSPDLPDR
jgi:hypothetical protein